MRSLLFGTVISTAALVTAANAQSPRTSDWPSYGNDPGGTRFSAASQITPANVKGLRLAWVARTGDLLADRGRFEATPLLVRGTLYVSTPLGSVLALDPVTGVERWRFAGPVELSGDYGDFANRGVAAWTGGGRAGAPCAIRIFVATINARLIALDGQTGATCQDFGDKGVLDLTTGLRRKPEYHWEYGVTSPPTIVGDLVIVGSAVPDGHRVDAPEGVIRAFDVRTGALRWSFDPIPRDAKDPAYATWIGLKAHDTGAANAWSIFSADSARDLVFIPVGSASPDFYGGERLGDNKYANSVVALRASTGAFVWAFQVVHHDLWDYDVPAQPVLFTLRRARSSIPAVAIGTKMGHVFVLDRRDGKPLFPVEERPVPPSDVPGEKASPTQPFPPPAFRLVPESLSANDAFGVTDSARASCRARIAALRFQGIFTPPSQQGTIIWPGNLGGVNWSGVSVDEQRGLLVAPTNRLAMVVRLIPRDSLHAVYTARPDIEYGRQLGTPYAMSRDDLRICTPPPWGALTAIDLNAGRVKWWVPLGSLPLPAERLPGQGRTIMGLRVRGDSETHSLGSFNLGGALLTSSGLAFIAGTFDQHLRAFDVSSGKELWSEPLPAAAHALPMTYVVGGRQYLVIAAGGHDRMHTTMGDYVLAFTLPASGAPAADTSGGGQSLDGDWAGEMRVGGASFRMNVTLRSATATPTATVQIDSIRLTGAIVATRTGRSIRIAFPFLYPPKNNCTGQVSLTVALWNAGKLLEGNGAVDGTCAERGHQDAAFVFRRR